MKIQNEYQLVCESIILLELSPELLQRAVNKAEKQKNIAKNDTSKTIFNSRNERIVRNHIRRLNRRNARVHKFKYARDAAIERDLFKRVKVVKNRKKLIQSLKRKKNLKRGGGAAAVAIALTAAGMAIHHSRKKTKENDEKK